MTQTAEKRQQFTIERILAATPERVWKMWTTKEGLEKWWGPDGFTSSVAHLDVRVGGRFEIVMTAVDPAIVAHFKSAGLPLSSAAKGEYTENEPNRRLVYGNAIDFVPGIAPYTTTTIVELSPAPGGTRLVVTNDAMHDPRWTGLATQGWQQQIGKLEKLLAG